MRIAGLLRGIHAQRINVLVVVNPEQSKADPVSYDTIVVAQCSADAAHDFTAVSGVKYRAKEVK